MGILEEMLGQMAGGAPMGGDPRTGASPASQGGSGLGKIALALLPVILGMLAGRQGGPSAGFGPGGAGGGLGGGGGGGLGDILGQILGGGPGGGGPGGLGGAQRGPGGLGDLLEQLERAGYGDQGRSWVGSGQNRRISPEDIGVIFGRDGLSDIARRSGLSEDDASRGLSELLPDVVNHVTPQGAAPDLDSLRASVDDLARRFGVR